MRDSPESDFNATANRNLFAIAPSYICIYPNFLRDVNDGFVHRSLQK